MNIQQLEYVLALAEHRNYVKAANACFVTQPALTIQIKKLEEELGAILFDRTKKPLIPTEIGIQIIRQARLIIRETHKLKDIVEEFTSEISGDLKLGIIPTIAPYLVPLFVNSLMKNHPKLSILIKEDITQEILKELDDGSLDAGIIVTPVQTKNMKFEPLFYEKFFALISKDHHLFMKNEVETGDLNLDELWLLKEGNCFRNQIINICSASQPQPINNFHYESVSIDSIINIVEKRTGITVIPQLAMLKMSKSRLKMIRPFKKYVPVREVSLVINRTFLKKKLIDKLKEEIINHLPAEVLQNNNTGLIETGI